MVVDGLSLWEFVQLVVTDQRRTIWNYWVRMKGCKRLKTLINIMTAIQVVGLTDENSWRHYLFFLKQVPLIRRMCIFISVEDTLSETNFMETIFLSKLENIRKCLVCLTSFNHLTYHQKSCTLEQLILLMYIIYTIVS